MTTVAPFVTTVGKKRTSYDLAAESRKKKFCQFSDAPVGLILAAMLKVQFPYIGFCFASESEKTIVRISE